MEAIVRARWAVVVFAWCLTLGLTGCAELLLGPDGVRRTQAAVIAAGAAADVASEKEQEPVEPGAETDTLENAGRRPE